MFVQSEIWRGAKIWEVCLLFCCYLLFAVVQLKNSKYLWKYNSYINKQLLIEFQLNCNSNIDHSLCCSILQSGRMQIKITFYSEIINVRSIFNSCFCCFYWVFNLVGRTVATTCWRFTSDHQVSPQTPFYSHNAFLLICSLSSLQELRIWSCWFSLCLHVSSLFVPKVRVD